VSRNKEEIESEIAHLEIIFEEVGMIWDQVRAQYNQVEIEIQKRRGEIRRLDKSRRE